MDSRADARLVVDGDVVTEVASSKTVDVAEMGTSPTASPTMSPSMRELRAVPVPPECKNNEFALNIFIKNKTEVVKKGLATKMGREHSDISARAAAAVMNRVVPEVRVATAIGENVAKGMPAKLASKGLTGVAKYRYSKENYAVVQGEITKADFMFMAREGLMPEFVAKALTTLTQVPLIEKAVMWGVFQGLVKDLPAACALDLQEAAGVDADPVVLPIQRQADYFFEVLKDLEDGPERDGEARAFNPAPPNPNGEMAVNIFIKNKEFLVQKGLSEALGKDTSSKSARVGGAVLNSVVGLQKVAREVGENVAKGMPEELAEKGITVRTKYRYARDNYASLQVELVGVDYMHLAADGAMPEPVAKALDFMAKTSPVQQLQKLQLSQQLGLCVGLPVVMWFLGVISFMTLLFVALPIAAALLAVPLSLVGIRGQLIEELPAAIVDDLKVKGGAEADVVVLPIERQADYFYEVLRELEVRTQREKHERSLGKRVQNFTGKESYQFGDLTKAAVRRARSGSAVEN